MLSLMIKRDEYLKACILKYKLAKLLKGKRLSKNCGAINQKKKVIYVYDTFDYTNYKINLMIITTSWPGKVHDEQP